MTEQYKNIAVGISGGVDSSVTAFLLQQEGHDVIGITGHMFDGEGKCGEDSINDAQRVCEFLGLNFHKVDLREDFKKNVIDYFLTTYNHGKTPNPCVVCNKTIKWGKLFEYAKEQLGCEYLATGHYAIIEFTDGEYKIKRSKDKLKDQTYMLINLTQEDLSHTIFPLGVYEKDEVKEIARNNDLPTAFSKESQDVCFIAKPKKIQEFLEKHLGSKPGNIVECSTGNIVGTHDGIYKYTVGQRRGIRISAPYPLYVLSIDTETNTVYVGAKEDIKSTNLIADNLNWISGKPPEKQFYALTKIRYNSPASLAQIEIIDDLSASVSFEEPQYAITPGQVVAFYSLDNKYLLGGGWIQ